MTEVLDIARRYLKKVKSSGNENAMAICPFHRKLDGSEEHGPSFAINVNSGLWFCHSCHASGNFYTFLRNIGLTHANIIAGYQRILDEVAKYIPDPGNPLNPVAPTSEPLPEGILGLFNYYPQLMADEGFSPEVCQAFSVGFDELHQRVTFPLRDLEGRLVGISGRNLTGATPRYKVYDKEYKDFGLAERKTEKRAIIWHARECKEALDKTPFNDRFIVVVEGFKAAMRVAQAGVSTVVALLGSALSKEQRWWLVKHEVPIYLMLDNNEAGLNGTLKAAEALLGRAGGVRFVEYAAPQPSDLTPEEVADAVTTAVTFGVWYQKQVATSTQ
jgi:DNA primase